MFLSIKITKTKICKIYKKTKTDSNQPVSVRFYSVWFGYFILKTKNCIVFWAFLDSLMSSFQFGSVWFIS
jgi:hypothetical protein